MRLVWNAIVKNESGRILRAAASVAPWIDSFVIVDTGSTDDTKQKIIDFFKEKGIPGEIRDEPFIDWSQARNAALGWARRLRFEYKHDHILLMDADMELVVQDEKAFREALDRRAVGWNVYQTAGTQQYQNTRFVRSDQTGKYNGVTHEYYDGPTAGGLPMAVCFFRDHADGANRPGKFERDIRLLKEGLVAEPNNVRYYYYLACSYRDAGEHDQAIHWFKKRVDAGDWDEERWHAQYSLAMEYRAIGDIPRFTEGLIAAYNMRSHRGEPMYQLARYYREQGKNAAAVMCAEAILPLPVPDDLLFVEHYVHTVGAAEELSIAGFYVQHKKRLAYKATSSLSLQRSPYQMAVENARTNIWWYYEPLATFCPSFKYRVIPFEPPENWIAMNPSITNQADHLVCNIRCVNYRIDEEGRYMIRGTDGTANCENPINTRNFLQWCEDPFCEWDPRPMEVLTPALPVEYDLVIGFEDMRLFTCGGELWSSSTVRQLDRDGVPEQVLSKIEDNPLMFGLTHQDIHRMLRQPRECQKNWAPIPNTMEWMYRPGWVVDRLGETVCQTDTGMSTGHISGGSQLVPFDGDWIAVVHEARYIPERPVRFYSHRFALYDGKTRALKRLSLPFYFNDKGIEFVAGMATYDGKFIISYGHKDNSARVASVDQAEVRRFLWKDTD